ncbi:hypothetical protein SAMN04488529_1021, partial [Clostridium gasigenes]
CNSVISNKNVFEMTNLVPGIHTAKIVVTSTKSNLATSSHISIDSINITN